MHGGAREKHRARRLEGVGEGAVALAVVLRLVGEDDAGLRRLAERREGQHDDGAAGRPHGEGHRRPVAHQDVRAAAAAEGLCRAEQAPEPPRIPQERRAAHDEPEEDEAEPGLAREPARGGRPGRRGRRAPYRRQRARWPGPAGVAALLVDFRHRSRAAADERRMCRPRRHRRHGRQDAGRERQPREPEREPRPCRERFDGGIPREQQELRAKVGFRDEASGHSVSLPRSASALIATSIRARSSALRLPSLRSRCTSATGSPSNTLVTTCSTAARSYSSLATSGA